MIKIIEATYGPKNITNIIQTLANNDKINTIINNDTMGGDPEYGTVKKLTIKYQHNNQPQYFEAYEGERLVIPPPTKTGLKIAAIISGTPKYHQASYKSIQLLKQPNTEIHPYLHVWAPSPLIEHSSFQKGANDLNTNRQEICQKLNPINYIIEDYEEATHHFKIIYDQIPQNQRVRQDYGPLSMWYSALRADLQRRNHETRNGFKYDIIIRMRWDTLIMEPINWEKYDLEHINIPRGRDWGGYNDQFAFGNSQIMTHYYNLYPNMLTYIKEGHQFYPEPLLSRHLKNLHINRPNLTINYRGWPENQ